MEFIIYLFTVTVNDGVINKPYLAESNNFVALVIVKLQKTSLRMRQKE